VRDVLIIIPLASSGNGQMYIWREQNKERKDFVNEPELSSEVAQLRQRILQEYEAAQQGLSGTAQGAAQHIFITQRLENMADHHQALKQLVGEQGATRILVEEIARAKKA
jgi:hypothetical protein